MIDFTNSEGKIFSQLYMAPQTEYIPPFPTSHSTTYFTLAYSCVPSG